MRFRNARATLCKLKFKTKLWFVGCVMRNSINEESAETGDDAASRCDCDTPWPIKTEIVWWFASIVRKASFRCCHRRAVVPSFTFMSFHVVCVHVRAPPSRISPFVLVLHISFIVCLCYFGSHQQTICLRTMWIVNGNAVNFFIISEDSKISSSAVGIITWIRFTRIWWKFFFLLVRRMVD